MYWIETYVQLTVLLCGRKTATNCFAVSNLFASLRSSQELHKEVFGVE